MTITAKIHGNIKAAQGQPLLDRIMARTVPSGDGCRLWTGTTMKNGYGQIVISGRGLQLAHRMAWEAVNGPIHGGLHVCHKCDVRNCVEPSHLFLGTRLENMADMVAKGRGVVPGLKGSDIGNSKLTDADVIAIRAAPGLNREIAASFGVSKSLVAQIKRRAIWRHIP